MMKDDAEALSAAPSFLFIRRMCCEEFFWLVILILLPLSAIGEEGLFPAKGENGLWGYIDARGNYVIAPQYAGATSFLPNYAAVPLGDEEWGIIDRQGKMILPMKYVIWPLNESGLFQVTGSEAPDMCVMDAMVENREMAGFLHGESGVFSGLQWKSVEAGWYETPLIPVLGKNGLYGYADRETGEEVISCRFDMANNFSDGWAVVNSTQYIDREGKILEGITSRAEEYGSYEFIGGLTSVFYQGKPAAMNTRGEIVFTLEEENVFWLWNFMENGLAWYMKWRPEMGDAWYEQQYWGLVDKRGNYVTENVWLCTEETGSPFSEGLAAASPMGGNGQYGYLNEKGELVIPADYDKAEPFNNGLAYVEIGERCGYIDKSGNEIFFWTEEY